MSLPKKLQFKTPAKINLGLHIHKKREDGFHELETLFHMVAWFDEMEIEVVPEKVELFCDAPGIPNDEVILLLKLPDFYRIVFPVNVVE